MSLLLIDMAVEENVPLHVGEGKVTTIATTEKNNHVYIPLYTPQENR